MGKQSYQGMLHGAVIKWEGGKGKKKCSKYGKSRRNASQVWKT